MSSNDLIEILNHECKLKQVKGSRLSRYGRAIELWDDNRRHLVKPLNWKELVSQVEWKSHCTAV